MKKKLIAIANDADKPVLYHNCGCAKSLLPVYRDLDLTIYETLAAPPEGDTDLKEAIELFSDTDLILMGTFDQVNFLKKSTPQQVFDMAAHVVSIGKPNGKYIFAASDYLEIATPIENVKAMIAGALSVASY